MNASEGLKRIAQVTRWVGYILATFCVYGAISNSPGFLILAAIVGCFFWAIAWIIDGFAEKK